MIRLLHNLTRYFSSVKEIKVPVFECNEPDVRRKKLPNLHPWGSFSVPCTPLKLTAWNLAHAIVKTDFLDDRNSRGATLGVLLQLDQTLDFSHGTLRLLPNAAAALNDVTGSSLCGRVGHGLGILFSHQQGYEFSAHLKSVLIRQGVKIHSAAGKLLPIADFMCVDTKGKSAIFEAKSTFSIPANIPKDVKTELRNALIDQIDPWLTQVQPVVEKSFALRCCLREPGAVDPTAIVFVDPPGSEGPDQIEISPERIRRENYAGWLRAMGLENWSAALLGEPREAEKYTFLIFSIAGIKFGFVDDDAWMLSLYHVGTPVMGMELGALAAIRSALDGNSIALLAYKLDRTTDQPQTDPEKHSDFSIFPDGSFFGSLPNLKSATFEGCMQF